MSDPSRLLIIGGASLDRLSFRGRTIRSAGGAGLYTALAARRAGVEVTMFAPRPEPMPSELAPAAERLDWQGPVVPPEDLPHFELVHHGEGRTEMVKSLWGAEGRLAPSNLAGRDLAGEWVYCIPLTDPTRQLSFVRHFKARERRVGCGTYPGAVTTHRAAVLQILEEVDVFFCNEAEAAGLFGGVEAARTRPGRLLFITLGARGAQVLQGTHASEVPGVVVEELDPTGAGDTFCGTTLAQLAQGAHPVEAARYGVAAAAEMVTAPGPAALLRPPPPPSPPADARVRVDGERVQQIAALLAGASEVAELGFQGDLFPPPGHPRALDFFFSATLQQFGFWTESEGRYEQPMIAPLRGRTLKGSDYAWAAYRRWLDADPEGLTPDGQARLGEAALAGLFRDDSGVNPLPALGLRLAQARAYGADLLELGWTPRDIVARANASPRPVRALLTQLDHVGGYKEDPLRKKAALLAMILQQRPERFLRRQPTETPPPIVDYHVQRSCLRMGLVVVDDAALRRKLVGREVLSGKEEWAVRAAAATAVAALQQASGRSMGALDSFLFQSRRRCPEMSEPDCGRCPADPACAHDKALFQPVIRTPFY
jgi:ribokinase